MPLAALVVSACVRRTEPQPQPPPADVAWFAGYEVWDGDMGTTVTRAGFEHQAVYRFDSLTHRVALPMGGACCLSGLAASPAEDRIAFGTYGPSPPATEEQKALTGVRVVGGDGTRTAWFAACRSPCWSGDGTWLAMIETRFVENGFPEPVGVRVVDRRGRSVIRSFQPRRIAWGGGDTLFLEFNDRVEALDVTSGKSLPTSYAGCEVSPDGEFSFRYDGQFGRFRVRRRAGGVELGHCMLADLGVDPDEPRILSPFWLRSSTRGHLLCLSLVNVATGTPVRQPNGTIAILDPGKSPPRQRDVHTVVFDPETFEVVHDLPGKVVVPMPDHRSLVVLLGDTLSRVPLPTWPPAPARPILGRVRVEIFGWSSGALGGRPTRSRMRDTTCTVAVGDWLPESEFGSCRERIRVAGTRNDSLELHLPAGLYGDYVRPDAGPHAARLLLGPTTVHLTTNSVDGGYDVLLTRVP